MKDFNLIRAVFRIFWAMTALCKLLQKMEIVVKIILGHIDLSDVSFYFDIDRSYLFKFI